jgi:hypothetical protein
LQLHDRYMVVSEKMSKLRKTNDAFKAANAMLTKEKAELEEQKAAVETDLQVERSRHLAELTLAKEEIAQPDQVVGELRTRLLSIAAEMFKEYLSGAHSKWNPQEMQEEVDTYDELQRLNLEESQEEAVDGQNVDQNPVDSAVVDVEENIAVDAAPSPKDAP